MAFRKLLASITLTLVVLFLVNGFQAATVGAQCQLSWHDVLWPEESTCRPAPNHLRWAVRRPRMRYTTGG